MILMVNIVTPSSASAALFEVSLSATGCFNHSYLDAPDDKTFRGATLDIGYPSWSGVGGCFGGFFEPRIALGPMTAGVEVGVIYSVAQSSGDVTLTAGSTDSVTLESSALIVPLHLKIRLPLFPVLGFNLGLGADFITPISADIEAGRLGGAVAVAEQSFAANIGFQVGLEFIIPSLELSIPLNLRGRYNSGLGKNYDARLTQASDPMTLLPEWRWQFEVHLGIAYPFLIF